MRKIFLISFDDGTVWDRRLVELLNKLLRTQNRAR